MPDLRDKLQAALGVKYRIVRELTGGGMSRVFLANDEQLQREVVVKLLAPDLLDEARVERFRQEVLQTARLQHPTIVPVIDVGAIESAVGHQVPFYIMPYARGESLRSRMHHEGPLSLSVSMRVLRSAFDALAYAHAHGVVHRDIKPENIFLSGTNALVADFGIAKAIAGPGSKAGVTSPGMAVGTPTYMAPEQIMDGDHVGPRADLFATGVVAYEMLTGKLPWGTQTPVETLKSQARGRLTPLRSLRPDVSVEMASVIEACLAWEPERRPESAAAVLHVLESVPVSQTPDSADAIAKSFTAERVRRGRRFPRPALVAVLVVIAVAAVLGRSLFTQGGAKAGYAQLGVLYPDVPADVRDRAEVAELLYHMLTKTLNSVTGLRLVGQSSVKLLTERGVPATQIADSLRALGAESVLALKASSLSGATMLAIELHEGTGTSNENLAGPWGAGALDQLTADSLRGFVRRLAIQSLTKLHVGSPNRAVPETQLIEAFTEWMRGRDAKEPRTPDGLRQAIIHFERAIELDSAYAGAHADLSQTMTLALVYHYRMRWSPFELATRALQEADRTVRLNPEIADGYLARGLLGVTAGADTTFIKAAYARAELLNSDNPDAPTWQLGVLGRLGQFDDAARLAENLVGGDPLSASKRTASAMYALAADHPETAIRNATESRAARTSTPMASQLELWGRLLLKGPDLAPCASVSAGPYLGAYALCLEGIGREREGRAARDSVLRMVTGKSAMDSTFDLALSYGELALYESRHGNGDDTRRWLRSAFADSPAGIDYRLMRTRMFAPWAAPYADSLQRQAWARVVATARPKAP